MEQNNSNHKGNKVKANKDDLRQIGSIHKGNGSWNRMKSKIVEVPLLEIFLRYPVILYWECDTSGANFRAIIYLRVYLGCFLNVSLSVLSSILLIIEYGLTLCRGWWTKGRRRKEQILLSTEWIDKHWWIRCPWNRRVHNSSRTTFLSMYMI